MGSPDRLSRRRFLEITGIGAGAGVLAAAFPRPVEAQEGEPGVLLGTCQLPLNNRNSNPDVNRAFAFNIFQGVLRLTTGSAFPSNADQDQILSLSSKGYLRLPPGAKLDFVSKAGPTLRKSEGYVFGASYEGDGLCHLASAMNLAASDRYAASAGVKIWPIVSHTLPIPLSEGRNFPSKNAVAILSSDPSQNLVIENNGTGEISFEFAYDGKRRLLNINLWQAKKSITPVATATPITKKAEVVSAGGQTTEAALGTPRNGLEMINKYSLQKKVILPVYGRPAGGWGSLGSTLTAEQSWAKAVQIADRVAPSLIIQEQGDLRALRREVAWLILNPVYQTEKVPALKRVYSNKALEMASQMSGSRRGIFAPDFRSFDEARIFLRGIDGDKSIPRQWLKFLSFSLDVEFFPGKRIDVRALNQFVSEFASFRQKWDSKAEVPAFVMLYAMNPGGAIGRIDNMGEMKQYYPERGIFVAPTIDGWGTPDQKLPHLGSVIKALPQDPNNPQLVWVMSAYEKWGCLFDKPKPGEPCDDSMITKIVGTLSGAPFYGYAIQ